MDASCSPPRPPSGCADRFIAHRFAGARAVPLIIKTRLIIKSDCNDSPPPIFAFAVLTAAIRRSAAYPAEQA
jgi:hypothetical protein